MEKRGRKRHKVAADAHTRGSTHSTDSLPKEERARREGKGREGRHTVLSDYHEAGGSASEIALSARALRLLRLHDNHHACTVSIKIKP